MKAKCVAKMKKEPVSMPGAFYSLFSIITSILYR